MCYIDLITLFEKYINFGEVKMYLKPTLFFAIIGILVQTSIVWAQDAQTGSYRITSTSEAILGKETATRFEKQLDIDEEFAWSVYVPESYDPANPPGILLYQRYRNDSSERRAKIEDPVGWKTAMGQRNMILIRMIGNGGEYTQKKELVLNLLAPMVLQQKYKINSSRVYTSADSECTNAGALAQFYPNIIKGAIYINCHPSVWRDKEPALVNLMRENRYYFIAGRDRTEQIDNRQ